MPPSIFRSQIPTCRPRFQSRDPLQPHRRSWPVSSSISNSPDLAALHCGKCKQCPKKACPSCGISVTILPLFFSLWPVELNQPRKSLELKFHHPVAGVATAQHRQGADARAVKASKHAQNARRARIYHIPVLPQKLACGPMHGGYFLPLKSQRPVPANRGTVSYSPAGLLGLEDREIRCRGSFFCTAG